jgi:hypothetical protein
VSLFKKKKKVNSDEMARALLDEFIFNDALDTQLDISLDEDTTDSYQTKMWLYRLALVLLVLMTEEQRNVNFAKVRESLEKLIFTMPQEKGSDFLVELKRAMQALNDLLFSNESPRQMSWAREWLKEIGVEDSNPVRLSLFAGVWMDSYIMVVNTLRELNPV